MIYINIKYCTVDYAVLLTSPHKFDYIITVEI